VALLFTSTARGSTLRPPSVPLVTCDPYFSIWSPADRLTDADTVHWTGKPQRLASTVRIDGKRFRVMGKEPSDTPALTQTSLEVLPTRTVYTFETNGVKLTLTFLTTALPDDLMIYCRPVAYITWDVESTDQADHSVAAQLTASAAIAVNTPNQQVVAKAGKEGNLQIARVGSSEQPVLAKKGDDLRIDWGNFYLAVAGTVGQCSLLSRNAAPQPLSELTATAEECDAQVNFEISKGSRQPASRYVILAYDDEFSLQYFKKNLRPYWRRKGADAAALLEKARVDYPALKQRCERFDAELMADLIQAGGQEYAKICALAYRQCYAANKVVADVNGQPLMFPKENFSNGCIGTVDVIYPMAPQFLLFCPSLAKAMLVPILDYAASSRWRWPFAPHDLGTYPLANGQVYGGGERTETDQMPVEETANMLLLLAALAQIEGNADFSAKYWPILEKWTDYLKAKGFDPENQLCTDDFAGHLAHNVNLSAKAICGLGAFAKLCDLRGDKVKSVDLMKLAKEFAARWVKEAADGDHFRLAFDKPGSWSQKYNLVWDRILGLDLFPDSVRRTEMDFYRRTQNRFGLPLDNRKPYTKLDWTLWTATLTQDATDFQALVSPVFRFLNETPNRVPMTDWYMTTDAKQVGFQARSVVGGVFLQMLYNRATWKKWASRDIANPSNWAPLPQPPKLRTILPAADTAAATWRFTTNQPQSTKWTAPGFDDSSWSEGRSGFGTPGTPGAIIGTLWNTGDIWLRREVDLPANGWHDPQCWLHHDEDAEVFINGVLAASATGWTTTYDALPLIQKGKAALHPGRNLIAIHCHQTTGGQYIDAGLVDVQ